VSTRKGEETAHGRGPGPRKSKLRGGEARAQELTRGGALSRLRLMGQKGGGSLEGEKNIFKFSFSINFQISVFKSHFEQENDIF
jgi:hypothetical protein